MITPEQWPRVKEIVGVALDREPRDRSSFLDEACSGDALLREEVDSLIAAYEQAEGLSSPAWEAVPGNPAEAPRFIGPYILEKLLGVGGMGQVWLAEQTKPVRRRVALKLIRAGFYDSDVAQRFLLERQSLALMNHPMIAKVFDAGTTDAGQPYFVMEYVDGCPINEYCDREKLAIADRLRLLIQVCEGVQHAHQKAIIHRDLKPSNILVIEVDGKPVPRIIDFGLAKASVHLVDGETLVTQMGALLGTPGYMSPEQVDPQAGDIDTRADVYSLGVVLYELLTGFLPFDASRWKKQRFDEMLRELRDTDPPRPSTKVGMKGNASDVSAGARSTEAGQLALLLRGDLDWITMKALEKDRERRYGTPTELASDIERYLENRPVIARPASSGYLLKKYLRRNRLMVSIASGTIALLLAFAAAQALQLRRVTRERDRADRITGFMTDMFRVSDPSEARGNSITAREILDKSSREIETGLGQDAEVQSQLMQVMALTYTNLGLYDRAHALAAQVLENRTRTLGARHPQTLESMTQMGWVLYHEGRDTEAEKLIRSAIAIQSRVLGPQNPLTLQSRDYLAIVLERQGHYAEAEQIEREVLPIATLKLGAENPQTLRSRNTLGSALRGQSRFAEAEKELRQLVEIERRTLGVGHPSTLATMHNLANLLQEQGRYVEAEALYRETLEVEQRILGPEHPETANTMTTLANTIRHESNRAAEAEALYRKSLDIALRAAGPDNSYTTRAKEGLANELSSEHDYAGAEKLLQEVLASRKRVLGPDHSDTLLTQYNLGSVLFRENQLVEAESLLRDTLKSQTRMLDANDPDTMATKAFLARILLKQGRHQEAEQFAREAFEAQLRVLGPQHSDTFESLRYLTTALNEGHQYPEAERLYSELVEQTARLPNPDTSSAWYDFACMAALAGHHDDAFDHLHKAIQAGYADAEGIRLDDDLKSLRSAPRFGQILAEAAAVQKSHDR